MKKKNSLPIKWVLGAFIVLTVIVYGTNQLSRNMLASAGSSVASHNIFFKLLANLLGGQYKSILSNEGLSENNPSNPNYSGSGGPANAGNQRNLNPMTAVNGSASQGLNSSQRTTNAANNAEMGGAESNSEFNAKSSLGTGSENNPESTVELNAEGNEEFNTEMNSENNPESNSEVNAESNAENNAETNSENNTQNNLGSSPENNQGGSSAENPETNSDQGPGNYSGGSQDNLNPAGLPTINPIPSDNTVSQNIAQQNQQSDTLAALLAAKHALVVPVEQQAQATKYQTVTSQNIPAVSTNPAPADAVAKIKSNQVMATH